MDFSFKFSCKKVSWKSKAKSLRKLENMGPAFFICDSQEHFLHMYLSRISNIINVGI